MKRLLSMLFIAGAVYGADVALPTGIAPATASFADYHALKTENEMLVKRVAARDAEILALNTKIQELTTKLSDAIREHLALQTELVENRDAAEAFKAQAYSKTEVDAHKTALETRLARIEQGLAKDNEELRAKIASLTKAETAFPKK